MEIHSQWLFHRIFHVFSKEKSRTSFYDDTLRELFHSKCTQKKTEEEKLQRIFSGASSHVKRMLAAV